MRTLDRNKQTLYYSLHLGTEPIYKTDDEGNFIYNKSGNKVKTGEYRTVYSEPKEFKSSISFSGGESQAVEFGIDFSSYDAQMITVKDATPIKEMSIIWHTSHIEYDEEGKVDPLSADYTVKRKSPSLNFDRFLLSRIVKNEED